MKTKNNFKVGDLVSFKNGCEPETFAWYGQKIFKVTSVASNAITIENAAWAWVIEAFELAK